MISAGRIRVGGRGGMESVEVGQNCKCKKEKDFKMEHEITTVESIK